MPFNQQMTFPCELTLRKTEDGVRLFARPVRELATLHGKRHAWKGLTLRPGENPLAGVRGELFDVRAEFAAGDAGAFGFTVRGVPVVYDVKKRQLSCRGVTAPLAPVAGKVRLHLLVDRGSVEVFGNDGGVALSVGVIPPDENKRLEVFTRGAPTRLSALEVYELRSAWR
jgi:fructan beta-fructosidase